MQPINLNLGYDLIRHETPSAKWHVVNVLLWHGFKAKRVHSLVSTGKRVVKIIIESLSHWRWEYHCWLERCRGPGDGLEIKTVKTATPSYRHFYNKLTSFSVFQIMFPGTVKINSDHQCTDLNIRSRRRTFSIFMSSKEKKTQNTITRKKNKF